MRTLALIYTHRVLGFKETQIGFDPNQKRNSNPKRKVKTRLPVDRAGRPRPTETKTLSVGRPGGRPLPSTVDRAVDRNVPVHVVHAGRLGSSTGRPGGRPGEQSGLF